MQDADPKIPGYKIYLSWKAVDLFGNGSIKPTKDNIQFFTSPALRAFLAIL